MKLFLFCLIRNSVLLREECKAFFEVPFMALCDLMGNSIFALGHLWHFVTSCSLFFTGYAKPVYSVRHLCV